MFSCLPMMHLKIGTRVAATLDEVKEGFTVDLFRSLNPPFPRVRVLEFGGCAAGDRVTLELGFLLFKQYWSSDVIEDNTSAKEWYFVDVGIRLPFFLKSWKHKHRVLHSREGSRIIDEIDFSTGSIITDYILFPLMAAQFLYRKPIYRRHFKLK